MSDAEEKGPGPSTSRKESVDAKIAFSLRMNAETRQDGIIEQITRISETPRQVEHLMFLQDNLVTVTEECIRHQCTYVKEAGLQEEVIEAYSRAIRDKAAQYTKERLDTSKVIGTKKGKQLTDNEAVRREKLRKCQELEERLEHVAKRARLELETIEEEKRRQLQEIQEKTEQEQRGIYDQLQCLGGESYVSRPLKQTSTPTKLFTPLPSIEQSAIAAHSFLAASSTWLDNFIGKMRANPFDGSPREWPMFIAGYESFVHETTLPDQQKILILSDVLAPNLKQRMAHLLQSPNTYETALNELKRRYGDPYHLVKYHVQSLLDLPICKPQDHRGLYEFSSRLHDSVATLQAMGQADKLSYGTTLEQLVHKLPTDVKSNWARYAFRLRPRHANIIDLDGWLVEFTAAEEGMYPHEMTQQQQQSSSSAPKQSPQRTSTDQKTRWPPNNNSQKQKTVTFATQEINVRCELCKVYPGHGLTYCEEFKKLSPTERAEQVGRMKNCFRCLGRNHFSANCLKETHCNVEGCQLRHHHLLHGAARITPRASQVSESNRRVSINATLQTRRVVLLQVMPILVYSQGEWIKTFALLDSASEATLMNVEFARRIGLKERASLSSLGSWHGQDPEFETTNVDFTIAALDHSVTYHIEDALTVPRLNITKRTLNWPVDKTRWSHLQDLPLQMVDTARVQVLIGMDISEAHLTIETRFPEKGEQGPRAVRTPLGWSVVGKIQQHLGTRNVVVNSVVHKEQSTREVLENFFSTEAFGTKPNITRLMPLDDKLALEIFEKTIKRTVGGYEIGLPWRSPRQVLESNAEEVQKQFLAQERRLLRQGFSERYASEIDGYLQTGHARVVEDEELKEESPEDRRYTPHFAVINPQKPGKVRVVFNYSFKHRGVSINDQLYKGPDFYPDLSGVILRARKRRILVSADIHKMFLQVGVKKEDQPFLSFWWREPGDPRPPRTHQMTVIPFGSVASPSACLFVVRRTLEDNPEFGDLGDKIERNMFVDNYLDSFDTEEEAIQTCKRITELLKRGGFRLNQWASSSRVVLTSIPHTEWNQPHLDLDLDKLPVERMLGIWYDAEKDVFGFKFEQVKDVKTLRQLVSAISSIFDPLGMMAPIVVVGKSLIQQAWKAKTDWDEGLPEEVLTSGTTHWRYFETYKYHDVYNPLLPRKGSFVSNYTYSVTHLR